MSRASVNFHRASVEVNGTARDVATALWLDARES